MLSSKRTAGGITISNLKLDYRAIVLKTILEWVKNKPADQWNKEEDPTGILVTIAFICS